MSSGQRGIGSNYGTSRDRPFDRWFRYPAGFSPEALHLTAAAVAGSPDGSAVDPFCGSAASASACAVLGRAFAGIEAHPLIADLARTKLAALPGDPSDLGQVAVDLVAAAPRGKIDDEHELVRRCFDDDVLAQLAGLRDTLAAPKWAKWRRHLRWALLGTLRDVASVKVGWPYQRPSQKREAPYRDAGARLIARSAMIADDLASADRPAGRVTRGDSRSAATWHRAASGQQFGACITSPPYLNNFDYADATRLELYFLGTVTSWGEMCEQVRAGMIVATTQQSARRSAQGALKALARRPSVATELTALTQKLTAERGYRDRGKEYDQVLPTYFAGLARVLERLHEHSAPDAICAWVIGDSAPYGIYIDTPRLVSALANDIGFEAIDDIVVRSRGLRWRTNGSRHQVPLSERLITFRRTNLRRS